MPPGPAVHGTTVSTRPLRAMRMTTLFPVLCDFFLAALAWQCSPVISTHVALPICPRPPPPLSCLTCPVFFVFAFPADAPPDSLQICLCVSTLRSAFCEIDHCRRQITAVDRSLPWELAWWRCAGCCRACCGGMPESPRLGRLACFTPSNRNCLYVLPLIRTP